MALLRHRPSSRSGKSTVAALVAGLLSGHSGAIRLGRDALEGPARRRSADLRRRVQMVFQDPLSSLNPSHSVEAIPTRPLRLSFGAAPSEAMAQVRALLAELELDPAVLARRPRQLSGGQQQRVALARALAAQPDLLLCDEITSALDVTIQAQVLALLGRLQAERGLAMLFISHDLISHDLAVVAAVSHRIAVLEQGVLRDQGAAQAALEAPTHPYTRRLLGAFHGRASLAPAAE